jgi:hypothetical protein
MIRVIVRTDDCGMAANVGGAVETTFRTIDIWHEGLEAFLREPKRKSWQYTQRQVIGVTLIGEPGDEM